MNIKTKIINVKTDAGVISGYASTWTREPDSCGDIVKQGAFADSIRQIKDEDKVLPLLFNHNSHDLDAYIGKVVNLEEDDHGLKFEAVFDDTPEGQRARELAMDGRLVKFSFAYDVIEQDMVELEDGREANELRKLNIHEVSLVFYPANPDTSIIDVKSGRRNSAKDENDLAAIRDLAEQITDIISGLLADDESRAETPEDEEENESVGDPEQEESDDEEDDEEEAKSKEPDKVNDEERKRIKSLLIEANNLLKKGAKNEA